jgi:hypothetical protein
VRATASDLVDCTAAHAAELAPHVVPFVASAIAAVRGPDGSIDWSALGGVFRASALGERYQPGNPLPPGLVVIGCAAVSALERAALERAAAPAPTLAGVRARADPRAGFAPLRRELWGGARFKVAGGAVL